MKLFQYCSLVAGLTLIHFNVVNAQDINFDDLKRQGRPLAKTVVISGLAAEAKSNLSRFDEIDSSRVAQREVDMRASANRYETQAKDAQAKDNKGKATQTPAVSTSSSSSGYICKVYCNSGTTSAVIDARSPSDAAQKIDQPAVADKICRDAGRGNASSKTMGSAQCSRQ